MPGDEVVIDLDPAGPVELLPPDSTRWYFLVSPQVGAQIYVTTNPKGTDPVGRLISSGNEAEFELKKMGALVTRGWYVDGKGALGKVTVFVCQIIGEPE